MRVKVNGVWYDAQSDAICIEVNKTEQEQIANMAPDAKRYAQFPDDSDLTPDDMRRWMADDAPDSLPGTTRDLQTMEQHIERAEQISVRLWAYRKMKLLHCQNNATYEQQDDILRAMRNDIGALISCIRSFQKDKAHAKQKTDT